MSISNYPNGFASGLNVRGIPVLNTYGGDVYWVHSGTGSNGNKGSFDRPFSTIDYAVGRCTADQGDILNSLTTVPLHHLKEQFHSLLAKPY